MKKIMGICLVWMAIQVQAGTVSYTFDETDPMFAATTDMKNTFVSSISYTQGTVQSGGGSSEVAYESNVPSDNLFAISAADIDTANLAYQATDSRLQFSLTVGAGGTASFTNTTLSFDLFAMNASALAYIVRAKTFVNVNGSGWTALPINEGASYHQIDTGSATVDHALNVVLYADSTDTNLTGSISASADVYKSNFSVALDSVGTLGSGDTVEFALFIWDNKDGNASFYTGVDNVTVDNLMIAQPEGDVFVNYTFDGNHTTVADAGAVGSTMVSEISYTQGTSQSGGGDSDVAYESNVPSDNLFAISAGDIDTANVAYQPNDSRLGFSLTAGTDESVSFNNATLSFDLLAMNASTLNYIVNARVFYNINGTGWVDASGGYHKIETNVDTVDHTLNTELYADSTDTNLAASVSASADVYESNFSVGLSSIGVLEAGDTVEFALFIWDNKDGNASFYAGADNIKIEQFTVGTPDVGEITLDILQGGAEYVLSWESWAGMAYAIEDRTELASESWLPVATNIAGTGGTISYTGDVANVQNFFRVVFE